LFRTRAGKSKAGNLVRYSQNIQCIFSPSSKTISFTDVEIDVWLAMIKKWMKWFEAFPTKHQKTKLVEQMIRIHDAKSGRDRALQILQCKVESFCTAAACGFPPSGMLMI